MGLILSKSRILVDLPTSGSMNSYSVYVLAALGSKTRVHCPDPSENSDTRYRVICGFGRAIIINFKLKMGLSAESQAMFRRRIWNAFGTIDY